MPHSLDFPDATSEPGRRTRAAAKRRAQVHTPTLQSIDTSPASIEAFQLRQQQHSRPFIQGGAVNDADIFGIQIPATPPVAQSTEDPAPRKRRQNGTEQTGFGHTSNRDMAQGFVSSPREENVFLQGNSPYHPIEPSKRTRADRNRIAAHTRPAPPFDRPRLEQAGSGRESLEFNSTLDDIQPLNTDMTEEVALAQGLEWPPSPKKSPVKRRLIFHAPPELDAPHASEDTMDHSATEDSLFGPTGAQHERRSASPDAHASHETYDDHDEDDNDGDDMPSQLPPSLPRAEARLARSRRNTLRRRRTTNVHEDPMLSPRQDASTRIAKPGAAAGNKSRQSSAESARGLADAVLTQPRDLGRETTPETGQGLKVVQDTLRAAERNRLGGVEERLWRACGESVERWNRGDFGGGVASLDIGFARW